jgi:hypothetical protein
MGFIGIHLGFLGLLTAEIPDVRACQHLYYPGPGDGPHVWQPKEQARAEAQCPCERPRVASVMSVYEIACARRRADKIVTSYTYLITSSSSSRFIPSAFPNSASSQL